MRMTWLETLNAWWYLTLFVLFGGRLRCWPVAPARPAGPQRILFECDPDSVVAQRYRKRAPH